MKAILISGLILFTVFSCEKTEKYKTEVAENQSETISISLSKSLEDRKPEFEIYARKALDNINSFAEKNGWQDLTIESFMDSVMIFDIKKNFDKRLLALAEADTTMVLPETYCAAFEKRILLVVSPGIYAEVYPEGIESNSYEKLLTHEIAHALHIRILNGNEDAMGPVWFYEGFAIYVANQFSEMEVNLEKEEIRDIMNNPDRGSYVNYGYIFRYFVEKISLKELVNKAKNENFNLWLSSNIE